MALDQLRPMPTTTFEVEPTADEVAFFAEHGFLAVERITTDEELDWLAEVYEHVFDPANAGSPTAPVDRSEDHAPDGTPLLSQAFFPEVNHPELLRTVAHRNARKYAAALLQVPIEQLSSWGHMIRKMPGGREASWHQDEGYWEPELEYPAAVACWLPMHDVTEEMGAMQFVPGSHKRGVLDHHAQGDPAMHLLTVEADTSSRVVCPLTKGGATFHHKHTLHYTAVNQTDRPRLAFPVEFQVAPRVRETPARRPWMDAYRAATGSTVPQGYLADGRWVPLPVNA